LIARPSTKRTPPGRTAGSADGTRIRLLKAAARVFAEHGYQDATVRQICERAGANIALVNYHFGDKLELYTEVLRYSLQPGRGGVRLGLPPATAQPADALRFMIGAMMERAFETGEQADLRFRLMLNEFMRPSEATSRVVDVVMRPVYDRLREIVGAILGLPANHQKTRLCVHSILGQVAHFAHAKPVLGLLWPEMMKMSPTHRELIVNHITEFSLAYLKRENVSSSGIV
jgi:TetR/AcrR family transcriptional regulator, regulator of cefoperazone and chloramphenicol sensitivity